MNQIVRHINDEIKMTVTSMNVSALATISAADAVLPENVEGMKDRMAQCDKAYMYSFQGGIGSLDEARALFSQGWQQGADRANELRAVLTGLIPEGTITRRKRTIGDEGDELRIEQALAGDWDQAWESRSLSQQRDSNVVSLSTGWIAPASINPNALIWNAVQLIVLADALENAGWRVELRAIDGTTTYAKHGYLQMFDVMMKRAEEPMRPDLIAATVGHAGVYRTLGFAAMWTCPKAQQSSLGKCIGLNENAKHEVTEAVNKAVDKGMMPNVSLVIPRADSEQRARKNILDAVNELFPQHA